MMIGILTPLIMNITPTEMMSRLQNWKSEQNRTPPEEILNSALILEDDYGCDGSTKSEELLQFPSGEDKPSSGWRHDRRDPGPGILSDEEGEGQDCWCGHSREEDKGQGREDPWDRRNELDEGEAEQYDQG